MESTSTKSKYAANANKHSRTSEEVNSTTSLEEVNSETPFEGVNKPKVYPKRARKIKRKHLMNYCRIVNDQYSCAVDSFLELSNVIFFPFLKALPSRTDFMQTLYEFSVFYRDYTLTNEDIGVDSLTELSLQSIRDPVWSKVCTHCLSFGPRDSNAQFSEIYSSSLFKHFNVYERTLFVTEYSLVTTCESCHLPLQSNVEVLLNYVSIPCSGEEISDWLCYINPMYNNSKLYCASCDKQSSGVSLQNFLGPSILLVEFDIQALACFSFRESISICDEEYELYGLVRHNSCHFTCAFKDHISSKWIFLDDLSVDVNLFDSLSSLYNEISSGWFFSVYLKKNCLPNERDYFCNFYASAAATDRPKKRKMSNDAFYHKNRDQILKTKRQKYENKDQDKKDQESIKRKAVYASITEEEKRLRNSRRREKYAKLKSDKVRQKENLHAQPNSAQHRVSKNEYLKEFDVQKNGHLHEQTWAQENMRKFHNTLKMKIFQCSVCKEAWPKDKPASVCVRCKRDKGTPKKFSAENNMVPSPVPPGLQNLTQIEEMLIALAFPVMQVYTKPRGGQLSYKGHTINLPNDVNRIAKILPNLPSELPVLILKQNNRDDFSKELTVRRHIVLNAIQWLIHNNPLYVDVHLDMGRIENLPKTGAITGLCVMEAGKQNSDDDDLCPDIGPDETGDRVYDNNTEMSSFLPSRPNMKLQSDVVSGTILNSDQMNSEWVIGDNPYSEFTTQHLASMAFPCLFPDCKGDPTSNSNIRSINRSDTESFADKIKHLIKFSEFHGEKWNFRFAAHPRFGFWAYNMLYRKRLLLQGNFYVKQNPGDLAYTIEELQDMVRNNSYKDIMKKLSYYSKNVAGTPAYWHDEKEKLRCIMGCVSVPTIFWTLSCADFHWPEYHTLFGTESNSPSREYRNNIINNPHLIDWFFTVRVENFVKYWLYETLGATWHWYRFEYAVQRGSIHCHGVAKLENDPGLCELAEKALTGFLAQKNASLGNLDSLAQFEIDQGVHAKSVLCKYVDYLMTCCNPFYDISSWIYPNMHPSKVSFFSLTKGNIDDDYADLVNCVQRHTKCNSAYCLRTDKEGQQSCRFGFPIETTDSTSITFEKVNTKDGSEKYKPVLNVKRNDCRLNRHQRLQLQAWRGNCDIQPIFDYTACLEYLAKYASKGESISSVAHNAFTTVIGKTKQDTSAKSLAQKLMVRCVGERDFSAQEVMHHILQLKMHSSTHQVITLSLHGSRKVELKNGDLETKPSKLDVYASRDKLKGCSIGILNCNLITFFSQYSIINNEIRKLKKPVVVRTYPKISSNPKSNTFPSFCQFELMKYKPWIGDVNSLWMVLHPSNNEFCQAWTDFLASSEGQELVPNWQQQLHCAESFFSPQQIEEEVEIESLREDWMCVAGVETVQETAIGSGFCLDNEQLQELRGPYSPEEVQSIFSWMSEQKNNFCVPANVFHLNVSLLNNEQKFAFNIVQNHLESSGNQLLMILTGLAGSGKSFLINNLRAFLGERCLVAAYFGLAAHNIKGRTLHSLLHLPVRANKLLDLQGSSLASLQEQMVDKDYLIIDEFSVIGLKLFAWLDQRCRQAKCKTDLPFGGLNVILVGDIAQLPPVLDKPLYHEKPAIETELQGHLIYTRFENVVRLTVNQRSQGTNQEQKSFRQLLLRLRDGMSTQDDWSLLMTQSPLYKRQSGSEYVKLCFTNETVESNNKKRLIECAEPIVVINARHNNKQAATCSSEDMGGLQKVLTFCKNARVMLTKNLWTEMGLCNGALGVLKHIIYDDQQSPPALPIAIIVQFDSYEGPSFGEVGCVPILPITNSSEKFRQDTERQQFPLKLAWSMTIHKSQGLTLDKANVDLGKSEQISGLSYVALSRVRALKDLIVQTIPYDRLLKIKESKGYKYRLQEEKRLYNLAEETKKKFVSLLP